MWSLLLEQGLVKADIFHGVWASWKRKNCQHPAFFRILEGINGQPPVPTQASLSSLDHKNAEDVPNTYPHFKVPVPGSGAWWEGTPWAQSKIKISCLKPQASRLWSELFSSTLLKACCTTPSAVQGELCAPALLSTAQGLVEQHLHIQPWGSTALQVRKKYQHS